MFGIEEAGAVAGPSFLPPLQGGIILFAHNPGRCPGLVCFGAFSADPVAKLAPIATGSEGEFSRIVGLRRENWLR